VSDLLLKYEAEITDHFNELAVAVGDGVDQSCAVLLIGNAEVTLEFSVDLKEGEVAFYCCLYQVGF